MIIWTLPPSLTEIQHTVLVADNDQAVRNLFAEVLAEAGYAVWMAAGAQLSMASIEAVRPDVVLVELLPTMPERALLLVKQLRADPTTAHLPVLLTSTNEQQFKRLAASVDQLNCLTLLKPCSIDQLIDLVAQATHEIAPQPRLAQKSRELR